MDEWRVRWKRVRKKKSKGWKGGGVMHKTFFFCRFFWYLKKCSADLKKWCKLLWSVELMCSSAHFPFLLPPHLLIFVSLSVWELTSGQAASAGHFPVLEKTVGSTYTITKTALVCGDHSDPLKPSLGERGSWVRTQSVSWTEGCGRALVADACRLLSLRQFLARCIAHVHGVGVAPEHCCLPPPLAHKQTPPQKKSEMKKRNMVPDRDHMCLGAPLLTMMHCSFSSPFSCVCRSLMPTLSHNKICRGKKKFVEFADANIKRDPADKRFMSVVLRGMGSMFVHLQGYTSK